MIIDQVSVFLENKAGKLSNVTSLLAKENINIRALSLADTSDFGILRLILDDVTKAVEVLKSNNITVRSSKVIAVEIDDTPGGLQKIIDLLSENDVNVEYMYAFAERKNEKALLAFRTDDLDKAQEVIKQL